MTNARSSTARVIVASTLGLLLGGCGQQTSAVDSATQARRPTAATTSAAQSPSPSTKAAQDCDQLLDSGWKAPAEVPDVNFDPETGIADITFGEGASITINIVHDAKCGLLGGLERIIPNVISSSEQARNEECASTVAQILGGAPVEIKGIKVDPQKLRDYLVESCPPRFAAQVHAK